MEEQLMDFIRNIKSDKGESREGSNVRLYIVISILTLFIGLSAWAETSSDVQSKLKALEDAHEAGILTDQEYAVKKGELEKQARASDAATQEKLKVLEAAHQAGILSDEEYAKKKAEILSQPSAVSPKSVIVKHQTYRHATGFSFLYPNGWTIAEQEGFLQLTPPDASSAGDAPTEMYFVLVEDVSQSGIQDPGDSAVIEYLDEQIKSLSPALAHTGLTSPADMRTKKGMVLDWNATGTGGEVLARAFVGIDKSHGLILIGMGLKQQILSRDPALRQIFASFGFGEPQMPDSSQQITQVTSVSSQISADEAGDPNWGFKFRPPHGWKFQKNNEFIILGHDTIAGTIFVIPHLLASFGELQSEMQSGITDEGVQLLPSGRLQSTGNNIISGEYAGIFSGQQAKAHGIGTFSPYGGGVYIVAVTTPDKYGTQLSSAADAVASAMQYFKVDVSELISHFAGTWATSTTSTLTNITLGPDGSYGYDYEAGYYGDFKDDGGYKTGFWDATGTEKGKGRWTVRGNKEQGVIIINFPDGTEETLEYKVFVEKGQTYWREYLFNGKHYSKIR